MSPIQPHARLEAGDPAVGLCRESLRQCLRVYLHPGHAFWRAIELSLIRQRPAALTGRILDLGCGDGSFQRMVFEDREVTGIDRDPAEIVRARRRNPHATLMEADACALPFDGASFDTVFSNCVIEHIPDLDGCLVEVSRVLKPGGRFMFTVPSERLAPFTELNAKLAMLHFLSADQWRSRLAQHGLALEEAVGYLGQESFDAWKRLYDLWEIGRTRGVPPLSLPFLLLPGGRRLHELAWRGRLGRLLESDAPMRTVGPGEAYALLVVARKGRG